MLNVFSTIEAFPRGRTTEELFVLCGVTFQGDRRIAILAELDALLRDGRVIKGRDGKWRPLNVVNRSKSSSTGNPGSGTAMTQLGEELTAAPALIHAEYDAGDERSQDASNAASSAIDPSALIKYWRSALRSDPRGRTTTRPDLHAVDWHLFAGQGPLADIDRQATTISINLDALGSDFRQALIRRDGEDNAVAIGWPLSVGRKAGTPVVRPIGLFSARWERLNEKLNLTIGDLDVLVNPDWLFGAAREMGWSREELPEIFATGEGTPLAHDDFVQRLREAAAGHFRGRLTANVLAARLDPSVIGIHDAAAIFLPGESSFTARASGDLDKIATWPTSTLAQTALAPLLGLKWTGAHHDFLPLNLGPLNHEQLTAVAWACTAPLSVVQGPPGTGKSQAIVSMAASVLMRGGSVLVASKNHQALDAIEDRLGSIAPDVPFIVRTLDPSRGIDSSFDDILKALLHGDSSARGQVTEPVNIAAMMQLAKQRSDGLARHSQRTAIEIEIAELLDRIESRERHGGVDESGDVEIRSIEQRGIWLRIIACLEKAFFKRSLQQDNGDRVQSLSDLRQELLALRSERDSIAEIPNLLDMSEQIATQVKQLLSQLMAESVMPTEDTRLELMQMADTREISGNRQPMTGDLAHVILRHSPLWLASVLGTGKRIPLEAGLFDLVIFDEASQCDIASAMPLFARAKRAVVVGDDKQLSFIPQLGLAQDRNLMLAQSIEPSRMGGMAQSKRSLFDCVNRIRDVPRITLRHQYRSAGDIVNYISETFYGGALVVAQPPGACVPHDGKAGLAWTHVPAPMAPGRNNVNAAEAEAVATEVHRLLVEQGYAGSIGAISPFRSQVQAIVDAVQSKVPDAMLAAADFRAATVDGFQGQERDLILFSPVLGVSSPSTAVTFVQKDKRRLNVAISRARAMAHVIGDLDFARSGRVKSLARLAAYATEPKRKRGEGIFDSEWEAKVFYALRERGLDPQAQFDVAGRRLDFALFGNGGIKLNLEIDGRRWHETPDGKRKSVDLWRDQQMMSLGWRVRRFWVDELASNMEACLDRIEQDLSKVE